ncbi:hypothetical protein HID58_059422, partial [Brassica napus]
VRPNYLFGPKIEKPTNIISLDAGEASGRRRRALCSVSCYLSSSDRSPPCSNRFRRSLGHRIHDLLGSPCFSIMPASFSHPQTFRSTPLRQCRRPFPPSLPHLVPGRGNLYPCVRGVPLFSKDSVPISCYLIRMSHFRTSPTRFSLTNAEVDGPLRDSEEIHCAALPLCLFVRPIFSGVPSSPLAEAHHPWLDGRPTNQLHNTKKYGTAFEGTDCTDKDFRWFPFQSSSSFEERTFPPYLLPMEEDDFSASLPNFGFSFITGLLSCVAVCTGPEDATEITMCCLAGEGCPSTSHYVTKSQLSDSVGYAPSTHPSFVLNSLSSCFEDLSFLIWSVIVSYVFYQRGWIIPSSICIQES